MALCQGKDLDKDHMRGLLMDTVVLLCKNGITFKRNIRVQGLLGITIDDDDIFLVQINENVENESSIARSEAGVFSAVKLNSYATSSANNSFIEKSSSAKRKNGKGSIDIRSQINATTLSEFVTGSSARETVKCKKRKMSDQNEVKMKSNHERDMNLDLFDTCSSEANVRVVENLSETLNHTDNSEAEIGEQAERGARYRFEACDVTSYEASDGINYETRRMMEDMKQQNDAELADFDTTNDYSHMTDGDLSVDDEKRIKEEKDEDETLLIREKVKKRLKCDVCEYTTSSSRDLNQHLRSVHSINKKFHYCTQCEYHSTNNSNLKQHIRAVHCQVKPYKCSGCEKSFSSSSNRDTHYRTVHCGYKPYTCQLCEYRCSQKTNLQNHLKIVHKLGVETSTC